MGAFILSARRMKLLQQLITVLSEELNTDPSLLNETTSLEELGMSSTDAESLAAVLRETFQIEITEEDLEEMLTVGDILECVREQKS